MRRGLLILGVLAACLTAGAAGATSSSTITARSTVSALAADGTDASFAAGPTLSDCDRVFVWQSVTRHAVQLGKKQRCRSKTQFLGLSITKGRALWLTASGGSVSTLKLWTATTKRPAPRLLETATRDTTSNDPQPILVGSAGGGLLPYAEDTAVTVLKSDGTVAFPPWTASAHVVALAARGGQVAVAQDGNRVTVLDSKGNIVSVDLFTTPVTAVALTGKGLLVQRGTTLELRRGADATHASTSPTGLLADADSRWAAWTDGKYVHVIRLPDETAVGTYPGTAAALAGSTLYIANGKTITIRTLR